MKKYRFRMGICCGILALSAGGVTYAENINNAEIVSSIQPEYILDELGIGLDMPEELGLVSTQKKGDYDNNGMITILGEDGVNSMIERLKNNNIYLYAMPISSDYKITIYMMQDLTGTGILGMTTDVQQAVRKIVEEKLYSEDEQDIEMGEYYSEYSQLSYVTSKSEVVEDAVIDRRTYVTVFNDKMIVFDLQNYNEEKLNESEIVMRELIDSVIPYATENTPMMNTQIEIMDRLKSALDTTDIAYSYDEKSASINLDASVLFGFNEAVLREAGKEYLNEFMPAYASIIFDEEFEGLLASVNFEGHTDTSGSYEYNLDLSQKRAEAVEAYCLEILDDTYCNMMKKLAVAKGYSFENPIYNANGEVDMDASRRVTISFTLDPDKF